jgi:hypothetical protein
LGEGRTCNGKGEDRCSRNCLGGFFVGGADGSFEAACVWVLGLEFGGNGGDGLVYGAAFVFERGGAVADCGEVGAVGVDEGDVAEGAVAGDDDLRLEGGEDVEGREPVGEAGVGAGEGGHAAHGVVSGEEDAVGGDEDGGVAAGVVGAHGEDADGGSAEVEFVLGVEGDVGFAEGGAFEEVGVDGGAGGEVSAIWRPNSAMSFSWSLERIILVEAGNALAPRSCSGWTWVVTR